jgi:phosphoribosylglycinamide formyltransferase 1
MKKIAIFASGSGSNAQAIAEYFKNNHRIKISCILTNRQDAFVLERARTLGIPTFVFNRDEYYGSKIVLQVLEQYGIDFIVLAGFLWLVPEYLLTAFPDRIINIHPALLPKYGGKGMFGMRVHEAVIANGDKESGITIHHVNAKYDEGNIIFQARCEVQKGDTAETLAQRIHQLEHDNYPKVIEKLVTGSQQV